MQNKKKVNQDLYSSISNYFISQFLFIHPFFNIIMLFQGRNHSNASMRAAIDVSPTPQTERSIRTFTHQTSPTTAGWQVATSPTPTLRA